MHARGRGSLIANSLNVNVPASNILPVLGQSIPFRIMEAWSRVRCEGLNRFESAGLRHVSAQVKLRERFNHVQVLQPVKRNARPRVAIYSHGIEVFIADLARGGIRALREG